jgi:hypothetical protein
MYDFDYTDEEIALLKEHDEGEILHEYWPVEVGPDAIPVCVECGDTEEGLMHNNTWRNVEPLLQD